MISIITVTYNAAKHIEKTVKSIVSQSSVDFEFILVDGESSDSTISSLEAILEDAKFPSSRFVCISEKDNGIYDAMNKGVRAAKGDYILFLNAGDCIHDDSVIEKMQMLAQSDSFDAIYGHTMMEFYEGRGVIKEGEGSRVNPVMPFIHQSIIVRRSLLLEHPFDLSYRILADFEFFLWMRNRNCSFHQVDFIVSDYDAKEGISENNPLTIALERDRALGLDAVPSYWLRKLRLTFTVGLIQPIKRIAPRFVLNRYFKKKKTYIHWKKRILVIAPFAPPVHGASMVSEQIRQDAKINALFDCDYVNLATSRSISEIGRSSLVKFFRFIASLVKTFKLLLNHKYDLCYIASTCHGTAFLKDSHFIILLKLFGNRIVVHQHNRGMSRDIERLCYRKFIPYIYKNVKVILLSWYLYPDISRVVKKSDTYICPNGIEVKDDEVFEKTDTRALFLSNLHIDKGILVLLDALRLLKEKGVPVNCDIVGGETSEMTRETLLGLIEAKGLSDNVIYHGAKYGKEKMDYYKSASIFVFPTYYTNECFPLSILEAMSQRLPVISTNVGAIRDEVEDGRTGIIIEPESVEQLADAIEKLYRNPELRNSMGESGFRLLTEKYTNEHFIANFIGILNDILLT